MLSKNASYVQITIYFITKRLTTIESREYGWGDPLRWADDTFYPQKLAVASTTSGGR
jgi:hypothetical protein